MCGRMAVTLPPDAMANLFNAVIDAPDNAEPSWNVCPTQSVRVAVSDGETRHLLRKRWGFLPRWYKMPSGGPLLINARAETIAEKPAFKSSVRTRRCLIAVSGFYEWTKGEDGGRDPWYIHPTDGNAFVFAGVWRDWTGEDGAAHSTFAVITCAANDDIAHIHHRMPVVLDRKAHALWLGEAGKGAAILMKPAPRGTCASYRVARTVNSNRIDGPHLMEPLVS